MHSLTVGLSLRPWGSHPLSCRARLWLPFAEPRTWESLAGMRSKLALVPPALSFLWAALDLIYLGTPGAPQRL